MIRAAFAIGAVMLAFPSAPDTAIGTNTRLRWTFSPLGDVFVVYNHNLRTRDPLTLQRTIGFDSNVLLVKVQYAFRYWCEKPCVYSY